MTLSPTDLPDLGARPPRRRAELTGWQRMEVETAYWAGRLEAAVRNLLDILDAVAVP